MTNESVAGIILAAGQGKRMQSTSKNKVVLPISGKPMIKHAVDLLDSIGAKPIVIVVGFAQESVKELFRDKNIVFAEQKERLGTANAVQTAIKKLPKNVTDVLILQGDDSAFYKSKTVMGLIEEHKSANAGFTFMTIEVDDPSGLGRIVRNSSGKLVGIVEEKDATEAQRKNKEINPACYVASVLFLKKYLTKVEPSPITGEFYLTSLIDIGLKNEEKIEVFKAGRIPWRGVNTVDELEEAERLYIKTNSA